MAVKEKPAKVFSAWMACGLLACLALLLFADVLFMPGDKVGSAGYGDVNHYFSTSRAFGFSEVGKGNLPLWDPYIFSGTPFLATFQSALLYPPNLIYTVLPLAKALSFDLFLHVLLFGVFTFAWARSRGVSNRGAFFSGAAAMLSGAFFYRVPAGHVTIVDGAAWMPLVLLAVDKTLQRPTVGWTLAGIFGVAMQCLAGMPQVVFLTAVTAGLLCLFRPSGWAKRPAAAGALASMGVFPLLLAAAQLFTSFHAMMYSKSHGGGSFEFSTAYSFPPANFLTLFAPHAFGDWIKHYYWGRWNPWETTFYIGIAGLFLAAYGMVHGPRRRNLPLYGTAAVLLLLALGRYSPVFWPFYKFVPGFSLFRAPTRFLIPCSLILGLFAGQGIDALFNREGRPRRFAAVSAIFALVLGLGALAVWQLSGVENLRDSAWRAIMEANYTYTVLKTEFMHAAGEALAARLAVAAGICALLALLLALARRRWAAALVVLLGVIELMFFAGTTRSSFRLSDGMNRQYHHTVTTLGNARLFEDPYKLNIAYASGAKNVWGYEPMIQQRYVEFFGRAMNVKQPLEKAGRDPSFLAGAEFTPLLRLLRMCCYSDGERIHPVVFNKAPIPEFMLMNSYSVVEHDRVLEALDAPEFDPLWHVILEEAPDPVPDPKGKFGKVDVLDRGTDHFVLEVNLPSPAILLNTDAYAPGWRVKPLAPAPQAEYRVLPADYAIRAIPLVAGRHVLLLEYAPLGFTVGKWVSIASAAIFLGVVVLFVWKQRFAGKTT